VKHTHTQTYCAVLDEQDPLRHTRERFAIPDSVHYLDGNSLGALPRETKARMLAVTEQQWGTGLIRSWNQHDWISLPQRVGAKIARLVGAEHDEVIAADSTSVNIFKLVGAVLQSPSVRNNPDRRVILSEHGNFPTDLYIVQGLNHLLGNQFNIRLVEPGKIEASLDKTVAVALITQVDYRTGYLHNMANLNARAAAAGTHIVWDLSHSAGALPVALNANGAELAVGCGYKYLNGGPGAPAYMYVAKSMQPGISTPLSGWLGHAAPFDFAETYMPAPGMDRFLCGTHSVLALSALDAGLDTFSGVAMTDVRVKSLALSDLFWRLMDEQCGKFDFTCVTPRHHTQRASQLSFAHAHAYAIMQAIIDRGVIGDFRQPNLMRFGFTPLYTRFTDVWDAVKIIREVMESSAWRAPKYQDRNAVT
jgi:kynureninase